MDEAGLARGPVDEAQEEAAAFVDPELDAPDELDFESDLAVDEEESDLVEDSDFDSDFESDFDSDLLDELSDFGSVDELAARLSLR